MKSKKVLLLEDDVTMLGLLSKVLFFEGFQSVMPKEFSRSSVMEIIKQELPPIIFLDVHLGEIDGFDLLSEIRADHNFSSIKVLMTSGLDLRGECLAAGADGFIMKPFIPSDLIDWLKQADEVEVE